ncbi:NlpC/P60 family protein [Paraflavitalea sp. CAU 1676]|uniref:C40 family peptidase n=1 Tax=Paraflavitalea sp. CAU 1676 TaxID=3032598 RepID=UPI0023DB4C81|nr:NlpC/P60 family protein [Paraflavitalea sp. CAU 1676]MDF2187812.1 NlpC/P60 family protein [Paraflavitalea sp. CAU 1676]
MENMLKLGWLILPVALAATSCSTQRKSTAAAPSSANNKQKPGSPRFIENISIKSSDSTRRYGYSHANGDRYSSGSSVHTAGTIENSDALQFKYSILLGLPVEELTDGRMISVIEDWYGTRYRYGGTDKNGIDCSSFAQTFISAVYGLSLPRTSAQQYQNSKRLRKDELQEGDLVFFKTRGRKAGVSHVGVYLRNNKFVHASTSSGVIINDMDDAYYASHYAGAGRIR